MNAHAILSVTSKALGLYLICQALVSLGPTFQMLGFFLMGVNGWGAVGLLLAPLPPVALLAAGFYFVRHAEPLATWAAGGDERKIEVKTQDKKFIFHLASGAVGLIVIAEGLDAVALNLWSTSQGGLSAWIGVVSIVPIGLGLLLVLHARRGIETILAAQVEPLDLKDDEKSPL